MGKVITINKKLQFEISDEQEISTAYKITLNGSQQDVETKISRVRNDVVNEYKRYNIVFYKKLKMDGAVYGKAFDSVLRKYKISLLVDDIKPFVFTLGMSRGTIPRASLKKLKSGTDIKCIEVGVDLIEAIPVILANFDNIRVDSGWFTKLGTQLQNALLQGDGVNDNEEWAKFSDVNGSKLTNVQFKIYDDDFSSNGYILMSLSSRGFIHTNSAISDSKYIKLVEEIVNLLDEYNALIYDKIEDEEDEEEEMIEDFIEKLDFLENEEYFTDNKVEINV
ncbi:Uncharacterised protein [[Clostridium] sordellii]|uniref:hypothetical protein n=1 Tax=Paraclostridium sordellii TaxID=1505 RepID=UPI0005E2AB13|nr:hypothetical protein [Paeniclostridium sordellii]CEN89054.1 Uncharacterised protein [[Clostridium] sordellii] [Paeniclostridium sordellii]